MSEYFQRILRFLSIHHIKSVRKPLTFLVLFLVFFVLSINVSVDCRERIPPDQVAEQQEPLEKNFSITASVQSLTNKDSAEITQWLKKMEIRLERVWKKYNFAKSSNPLFSMVSFSINKNGKIDDIKLLQPSQDIIFDDSSKSVINFLGDGKYLDYPLLGSPEKSYYIVKFTNKKPAEESLKEGE